MMKFYKVATLLIAVLALSCVFASANEVSFNTEYQSESDQYIVTGNVASDSKVLLLVYSPIYDMAAIEGLYYFEAINSVQGDYSFTVKMKEDAPIGTYIFKVSVNGKEVGSSEQAYTRGVYNTELEIQKFVFDTKPISGGTVSVIAGIKNLSGNDVVSPSVVIALYDKTNNSLKDIKLCPEVTITNGEYKELIATLSDLPSDIGNYTIKGYMLNSFDKLKPITKSIIAD